MSYPPQGTGHLAEDVVGSAQCTDTTPNIGGYYQTLSIEGQGSHDVASVTKTFASLSRAVGVAFCHGKCGEASKVKLRLIMGGVQVAESAYLNTSVQNIILVGTRALSGSQTCISRLYNTYIFAQSYRSYSNANGSYAGGGVAVGSIKI